MSPLHHWDIKGPSGRGILYEKPQWSSGPACFGTEGCSLGICLDLLGPCQRERWALWASSAASTGLGRRMGDDRRRGGVRAPFSVSSVPSAATQSGPPADIDIKLVYAGPLAFWKSAHQPIAGGSLGLGYRNGPVAEAWALNSLAFTVPCSRPDHPHDVGNPRSPHLKRGAAFAHASHSATTSTATVPHDQRRQAQQHADLCTSPRPSASPAETATGLVRTFGPLPASYPRSLARRRID